MEEKEWTEPELIVLVRSKPEEAVLGACKTDSETGGNANLFSGCWCPDPLYGTCDWCSASRFS
jgi:hypothetical protein